MAQQIEYVGGYTVIDQRDSGPEYRVRGHYPTLEQAARAARFNGALILRSVGMRYDISGSTSVSGLTQKVGVFGDGSTFVWPA